MTTRAEAQLIINEVMQSNIDLVLDDLNQYPDSWVELYNTGTTVAQLSQYSIADTLDAASAYALPAKTVAARSFQLVYCDKEQTGLHTPFRLETGKGCRLYLFRNGVLVDSLSIARKQPAPGIAYGRESDGSGTWGYMLTPTPAATNQGGIVDHKHVLGDPVFDVEGQVFESGSSVKVTLSLPADAPEGTVIRYTYGGNEPTLVNSSPTQGITFTLTASKVIRARLFCDGWLSPRSVTQSYIFLDRAQTLPVVSLVTDAKHLTGATTGIYVDGSYDSSTKNYEYDWRRPVNFEYFSQPGTASDLNQLCETRVCGAASRGCTLKSLALYAHKRFGQKMFDYEFFPDQRPGQTQFKSVVLRNAGNDFDYLYMRDALAQRVMASHQDMDWQAWSPAIVYINGTYKGILNIRERGNDNNIWTNYDGLEDIDLYENTELKNGTADVMTAFKAFYNEHGHTMADYAEWMDCDEYINLMAMEVYFNNVDFPGNNSIMWRPRTDGGRWRWLAKDVDYTLNLYSQCPASFNYLQWLYDPSYDSGLAWANGYDATRLFRRLMEDADFSTAFCDRMALYMDDFLNYDAIWSELWQPMYERIRTEYPTHRKLFNQWWPNYDDELTRAATFVRDRNAQLFTFLKDKYGLGNVMKLEVNASLSDAELADLQLAANGVGMSKPRLSGSFWAGRRLTLSASASEGREVVGWEVIELSSTGMQKQQLAGATMTYDIPASCTQLVCNAIVSETSGIVRMADEDVSKGAPSRRSGVSYDLWGRRTNGRGAQGMMVIR